MINDPTAIPVREPSTGVMDAGETAVIPPASTHTSEPSRPHNPLENVTPEKPRSHPIAYAALALATLALILALFAMRDDDGGFRQVKVGNADCVIGSQDGADVLYCRTAGVPAS